MSTCPLSGIAPPDVVTLAAAADGDDSTAVVVKNSDCDEEEITAVESENPGEYMINASYLSIKTVASYPEVASLRLWNNQISEFKSVGTSVKQIDLTSNQLTTLDGFDFPSSLQQLTLDLNAITSTKASNFPDSLLKLYLRKNSISSLAKFRFPSSLQSLYINGNQELDTLEGAVLPDSLVYLECSDCRVTSVAGVVIPTSLKTLTLGGTTLTSFVVRESDVTVLKSAALSLTTSISSCTTGTLTPITDNINACVLDDVTFLTTYPSSADSGSSDSTAASSSGSSGTSSSSGGTTGGATGSGSSISSPTASPGDTGASSGSSGSNTGVIAGIIAAVVVVLAVIGFLVYRRRRRVSKDLPANSVGTTVVMLSSEDSKDGYIGSIGTHATGSTGGKSTLSGFMSNDVRNDEELIPYRLPLEEIELQDELGAGAFGVVHLAMLRGQQLVVVKSINPKASAGKDVLTRFMDEIRLYARMDHPKIVQFVGVAWTNLLDLSLILEFMPNGDLADLLKASRRRSDGGRQTFSWLSDISRPRSKIDIALDVAEALVYLHSFNPPIIHRDLKARNVLLSAEWEAKVSDFGISREMSEEVTMTGGMGTTPWIAPEVLQGERYSEKADIYSFGILLSEIDTCGHPFNSNRSDADKLTDAKIALLVSTDALKPTIEPDCPAAIRDLILRCVSFNPDSRPNAIEFHYQLRRIRNATMGGGFF